MGLKADLYLDRADPLRYLSPLDCKKCGSSSCSEWLEKLKTGEAKPQDCPSLGAGRAHGLEVFLSIRQVLPEVDVTQHPLAGPTGMLEINAPGPDSPVLVTGNALQTQEVVLAVLSTTSAPFHLLFVDTKGHTVDMAMIYNTLTPEAVCKAASDAGLESVLSHRQLIIPGLAALLKEPLEKEGKWQVTVGPVCVGELPLFFGNGWTKSSEDRSAGRGSGSERVDLPGARSGKGSP